MILVDDRFTIRDIFKEIPLLFGFCHVILKAFRVATRRCSSCSNLELFQKYQCAMTRKRFSQSDSFLKHIITGDETLMFLIQ